MPLYEHENWGDIQDHTFMKGVVTAIFSDDDTADVTINGGPDGTAIPIFYHCTDDAEERSNGSIEGGAKAFTIDDEVIVMCNTDGEPIRIVGFVDGIKICQGYIAFFRAGYRLVAWDIQGNCFARIPKSDHNEETGEDTYNGDYVEADEWPLGNWVSIRKWYNDSVVADGSENLFDSEWVITPNRCPVDDIADSVDDGSGWATITSHMEWRAASRERGSSDWPYRPAPDSASAYTRTWGTIFGTSTHTVGGQTREERRIEPPDGTLVSRFQKRYVEDTLDYSLDEWSGIRFTALNPAGGELDFKRFLEVTGGESITKMHGSWFSYVTKPWGDDNHNGNSQYYSFSASYMSSSIGGVPIFNLSDMSESDGASWDCVADERSWDVSQQICTPPIPAFTPLAKYHASVNPDMPNRASVEQMLNIVCETREPEAVPFEEQRVYGYIFDESSHFDPAVIVSGNGKYRHDEDMPGDDFLLCLFVREKTEVLPNCMDFEVFAATKTGGGVGASSVTSMDHLSDDSLNQALIEMINLETQTGDKWRANPYCEMRRGPALG